MASAQTRYKKEKCKHWKYLEGTQGTARWNYSVGDADCSPQSLPGFRQEQTSVKDHQDPQPCTHVCSHQVWKLHWKLKERNFCSEKSPVLGKGLKTRTNFYDFFPPPKKFTFSLRFWVLLFFCWISENEALSYFFSVRDSWRSWKNRIFSPVQLWRLSYSLVGRIRTPWGLHISKPRYDFSSPLSTTPLSPFSGCRGSTGNCDTSGNTSWNSLSTAAGFSPNQTLHESKEFITFLPFTSLPAAPLPSRSSQYCSALRTGNTEQLWWCLLIFQGNCT